MTNAPLPSTKPDPAADRIKVKVVGIGGAGSNVLDRLVLDDVIDVDLVSCNTDVQSLASSVATQKVQLGRTLTRGLGAGGDPEIGFAAAEEAAADISAATEGTPLVFILAGLGGGTGSGAAPLVAKLARERGALVLACVTLPFSFEGRRRREQAAESLRAIQTYADAVICFENDRMGEVVLPTGGRARRVWPDRSSAGTMRAFGDRPGTASRIDSTGLRRFAKRAAQSRFTLLVRLWRGFGGRSRGSCGRRSLAQSPDERRIPPASRVACARQYHRWRRSHAGRNSRPDAGTASSDRRQRAGALWSHGRLALQRPPWRDADRFVAGRGISARGSGAAGAGRPDGGARPTATRPGPPPRPGHAPSCAGTIFTSHTAGAASGATETGSGPRACDAP